MVTPYISSGQSQLLLIKLRWRIIKLNTRLIIIGEPRQYINIKNPLSSHQNGINPSNTITSPLKPCVVESGDVARSAAGGGGA